MDSRQSFSPCVTKRSLVTRDHQFFQPGCHRFALTEAAYREELERPLGHLLESAGPITLRRFVTKRAHHGASPGCYACSRVVLRSIAGRFAVSRPPARRAGEHYAVGRVDHDQSLLPAQGRRAIDLSDGFRDYESQPVLSPSGRGTGILPAVRRAGADQPVLPA